MVEMATQSTSSGSVLEGIAGLPPGVSFKRIRFGYKCKTIAPIHTYLSAAQ